MKRRRIIAGVCAVVGAGLVAGGLVWHFSGTEKESRGNKLLALAASEAGQIKNVPYRLTRQLNIADLQSQRGQNENASKSLAAARETIGGAVEKNELSTRVSMAGYVSISQLARRVNDKSLAASACEDAQKLLQTIMPIEHRVPYVYGLALELKHVHGDDTSAKFVREAGPWAAAIDDVPDRRAVLLIFADSLFGCEDYDGGLAMLRHEDDPAWRSERLEEMANASYQQEEMAKKHAEAKSRMPFTYSGGRTAPAGDAIQRVNLPMEYAAGEATMMRNLPSEHAAGEDADVRSGLPKMNPKHSYAVPVDLDYRYNFQGREKPAEEPELER